MVTPMVVRCTAFRLSTCCATLGLGTLLVLSMTNRMSLLYRDETKRTMTTSETDDNEVRRDRIRSVCEAHRSSSRLHNPSPGFGKHLPSLRREDIHCYPDQCPVFVDDSRSLAFCFIDKVASTSLKTVFAKLLNVTVIGNESDALHWSFHSQTLRLGPRTLVGGERKDYFKALFVRHPFERLVSTYIDKALRSREEIAWAYSSYWDKIPGVKAENRSPTFAEFVDFVLAVPVENSDTHWSPYYHRCQPCLVDYDFVGELETANRDFPLFFSLAGIEDQAASLRRDNSRESVSGAHRMDSKYYFAQLSFEQVMGLYARYFYDFALFSYEFNDYLT